ncbi:MAG: DUF2971 domain-containing protein [Planctomycetota bacterium]|nr:DUF2971 domain-containing protein [Planctomycetota bacterium]
MLVYKYLSPARVDVVESALIRFTPPLELNDPFEAQPCLLDYRDHLRAYLAKECGRADKPVSPADIDGLVDTHISNLQRRIGEVTVVLSLSKNCDNRLMWSHYGKSHQGFVIGFDSDNDFFSVQREQIRLSPTEVQYSAERANVPVDSSVPPNQFLAPDREFLLTKSQDWAYEEEIRVLADPQKADITKAGPNGRDISLFQFPSTAVREIILGYRIPTDLASTLTEIVRSSYSHARILRAALNERLFKMDINV